MGSKHPVVSRITEWFELSPPESFTYRSYVRYTLRALPRYGAGPVLVVCGQAAFGRFIIAGLLTVWSAGAYSLSLTGFALVRRDPGVAVLTALAGTAVYLASYLFLVRTAIQQGIVGFAACFELMATLVGAAAAHR